MTNLMKSTLHLPLIKGKSALAQGLGDIRSWYWYCATLLTYSSLLTYLQFEHSPRSVHFPAILLMAISLLPITLWWSRGSRGLPMFELICVAYAVQFSLPVLTQPNSIILRSRVLDLPWEATLNALLLTSLGVSVMILGYYVTGRLVATTSIPRINLPFTRKRRSQYVFMAIVVGTAVAAVQVVAPYSGGGFGAVFRIFFNQLHIAIVLLAYQYYGEEYSAPTVRWLLYGSVAMAFVLGLAGGLLENALIPVLLVFIVRWHSTRKLPWRYVAATLLFFLILNPVKAEYRRQTWGNESMALSGRISLWYDLSADNLESWLWPSPNSRPKSEVLVESLNRLDLLHKFAYVQMITPNIVPFYEGATYAYLGYGWIPRMFWADKPVASAATNMVDRDYGFLTEAQSGGTNIGIGHLPEAYANFGVTGVVCVLLLQGICFALLSAVLNSPESEGGRAVYLTIMIYFLNGIGTAAVIFFGSLAQNTAANVLILKAYSTGYRPRAWADRAHRK